MTYITDDEIASLPEEPEQRFVALERLVRERYEEACQELGNDPEIVLQRRYMSIVLPAAQHYGISALAAWERPEGRDDKWQTYDAFMSDVEYCVTALRLQNIEGTGAHSVALDAATKMKLRHLLDQVRETVDRLEISVAKKDALYKRIGALQAEIDRERTRWEAFAALIIEACDDTGEAARRLEPVVRLIERVGSALGIAKRAEDAEPKLPTRKEPKKLEPPQKVKKNGFDEALDDGIPF